MSAKFKPYAALIELEKSLGETSLSLGLRNLMKIRASQLNGCAYCVNSHTEEALENGEDLHRITLLTVWPESQVYTPAEKAALRLTEAVTYISEEGVPEDLYEEVLEHYTKDQYLELLAVIFTINAWNRIGVGTGLHPVIHK
ncbi:MAG: hypothetical protein BGO01_21135 [Armatimonadetes bacterium 55-13]|nr:carboxymuconolactone decarboxylase family protein [Armatimonadota bacterium]OJU64615.1 MAG: hypothetical protein BGO01_21135 [Armatimonadetes bacterium 55-13]